MLFGCSEDFITTLYYNDTRIISLARLNIRRGGGSVNVYRSRKVYTIPLTRRSSRPRRSLSDCQARSPHYQHRYTECTLNPRRGSKRGRAQTLALLMNDIFCSMACHIGHVDSRIMQYLGTTESETPWLYPRFLAHSICCYSPSMLTLAVAIGRRTKS